MIVSKNGLLSKYYFPYRKNGIMQTQTQAFSAPQIESFFVRKTPYLKRIMDIVLAMICLVLFSPIMIFIAIAIKMTSEGPVLFKQDRVGEGGKTFKFLKFRSMYHNCDQTIHQEHIKKLSKKEINLNPSDDNKCSSYKLQSDDRVTNIGKFLRRTSLDELPQLFNVLKGDMSFVGPRPYPVYQTLFCTCWQRSRLCVKPGITGLSQVCARFNTSYEDAYRLDVRYIKDHFLWLDLKLLFQTLPVVLSGKGAV
jgi:lipopolysaccharide/colanic/teichoic acid biosynthesis glycosyltransferase